MAKLVILGCGWLGQQLGVAFARVGWQVIGTRQSAAGLATLPALIQGQLLSLPSAEFPKNLIADAVVIVALPASMPNYLAAIEQISQHASGAKMLLFCSSTGIYSGLAGDVYEDSVPTLTPSLWSKSDTYSDLLHVAQALSHSADWLKFNRQQKLIAAEMLIGQLENSVILRLAGLIGPQRHPSRFVRGGGIAGADLPVNIVHSDEIVRFCLTLLNINAFLSPPVLNLNRLPSRLINLCNPWHPSKQQFYQAACAAVQCALPQFLSGVSEEPARIVHSELSLQFGDFNYQWDSPSRAIAACS